MTDEQQLCRAHPDDCPNGPEPHAYYDPPEFEGRMCCCRQPGEKTAPPVVPALSLEQFIERAAKSELAAIRFEWESMQRQVKALRAIATELAGRCDWILTGKPYDGPQDVEPF